MTRRQRVQVFALVIGVSVVAIVLLAIALMPLLERLES
jgi:hypothetical protein